MMSKPLTNFLLIVLFLGINSVFVLGGTELSVYPMQIYSTKDESFLISININTTENIIGAQFDINFNPLVINVVSYREGGFLSKGSIVKVNDTSIVNNPLGKLFVVLYVNDTFSTVNGSGSVLNITFKSLVKNGVSSINLDNIIISNITPAAIDVSSIDNGTVNVVTKENILINEFMPDGAEWIELYNNDTKLINLSGWKISDDVNVRHTFSDDDVIEMNKYKFVNKSLWLNNDKDTIYLHNNEGSLIDFYNYSGPGTNKSMGRMHDGLDEWVIFDSPTPNAANNRLPTQDIADQSVNEDTDSYFLVTNYITDRDNDNLTFAVVDEDISRLNCNIVNQTNITLSPAHDWNGVANCTIGVDDGYGRVNKLFYINVIDVNDPPTIKGIIPNITIYEEGFNNTINLSNYFSDIDDKTLTYLAVSLGTGVNAAIYNSNMLNVSGVLNFFGNIYVNITASDGGYRVSQIIDVIVNNVNDAPYFNPALENRLVNEDSTLTYDINASDVDTGDVLSFTSNISALGGEVNNSIGILKWTPDNNYVGTHHIKAEVCDNSGADNNCTTGSFAITVNNVNNKPTLAVITDQTINEDSLLWFNLNGEDVDLGDTLSYSCNLTALNIDNVNNTLANVTWTPTNYYVGNHSVNCAVRDAAGEKDSKSFIIEVKNTNDAPVLAFIGDKTSIESLPLTFTLIATDEDPTDDPLTFATNASVGNFNLNPTTGAVTFTPTYADVGVYIILFNVNDGKGGKDEEIIELIVSSALDITDIRINGKDVNNGSEIGGFAPGDILNVQYKIKNRFPNEPNREMVGVETKAIIHDFFLERNTSEFILNAGETKLIDYSLQIPYTANITNFDLMISSEGFDLFNRIYSTLKTVNLAIDRDLHRIKVTNKEWSEDSLTCTRDTKLFINLVNTGNWSEEGTLNIYNKMIGMNETKSFALDLAEDAVFSFDVDAGDLASNEVLSITIKYYHNFYTINDSIGLIIADCLNVQSLNNLLNVSEDQSPLWSPIDLKHYTYGNTTGLIYEIVKENIALIDCNVTSDGMFSCGMPTYNLYGSSIINMSIGDVYEQFNVGVLSLNDPPSAYNISISLNEDSSTPIQLNCTDVDDGSLSYIIVSNPMKGSLSGSENLMADTYTPNPNYNGSDSFTYGCNDGKADGNVAVVGITVNPVLDKPSIVGFSPEGDILIGDNFEQEFSITVDDPDNLLPKINWYVDGNKEYIGEIFAFNKAIAKTYKVIVNLTNASETESYGTKKWDVRVSTLPVTEKYSGTIEDVDDSNVNAFSSLTIEKNNVGKIDLGNRAINLSNVVDVDRYTIIEQGIVGINSSAYGFDVFKIPATITMYGLGYDSTPKIYYNNGFETIGTNECTSTTDPSCTNINYNATTRILIFDVSHFTIFFLPMPNRAPTITSSPITTAIQDEEYRYDVEATDPENDPLQYSLTTNPTGMVINSNTGLISWTPSNITKENVTISVTDGTNTITQPFEIEVKEGAKLRVSDLDVKVGDKTHKDLSNGATISRKAKPGDNIKFDIEIENRFSSSSDISIEDIEITITIKDIDDGDDLEDSIDIDDLDSGDDDSAVIEFVIPTLVDEDVYDAVIELDGEDENGKDQQERWELNLEVKKDKHDLLIDKVELSPLKVECNRNPSLDLKVINIGREDEDEIRILISNEQLGLNIEENNIELEEGSDEDSIFEKTYRLNIDDEARAGVYPISIKAYYDSKVGDEKTLDLTIEDCVEAVTPVKAEKVEIVKIPPKITKPIAPITKISFRETPEYLTLLAILFVILFGGVIFLIGAVVITARKR